MSINLKGRSFLTLRDFSSLEIEYLLQLSHDLKEKKRTGHSNELLKNKSIVLIFDKPSTRTRCAFEVATYDEGGHVTFLENSHMGKKESLEDTAKVLGRMYDGIQYRGYSHSDAETLALHAGIPVWNGLTDQYHPTQILADLLTIREHIAKPLNKVKLVYVGDARNNMGNSLLIGAAKMGMHFVGLAPKALWPEKSFIDGLDAIARETNATLEYSEDIATAIKDADVIYTDVWFSMGEEDQMASRIEQLKAYQVTMNMIRKTQNSDVVFMHCLPAYHDTNTKVGKEIFEKFGLSELEVTDEVFRSRHSIVFDQAENRLHTIKAVIVATIGHV